MTEREREALHTQDLAALGEGALERAVETGESVSKYDPHSSSSKYSIRAVSASVLMFLGPAIHTAPSQGF